LAPDTVPVALPNHLLDQNSGKIDGSFDILMTIRKDREAVPSTAICSREGPFEFVCTVFGCFEILLLTKDQRSSHPTLSPWSI